MCVKHASGHPLLLTVVYGEVARRAGIPMLPVGRSGTVLLAHADGDEAIVLDPAREGRLIAPDDLPQGLRWLCPHETGFAALDELVGAWCWPVTSSTPDRRPTCGWRSHSMTGSERRSSVRSKA